MRGAKSSSPPPALRREPAGEMVGIVGKGAHPPRRHVEQMLGPRRSNRRRRGPARAPRSIRVTLPTPARSRCSACSVPDAPAADHRDAGGHAGYVLSSTSTLSARLRPSRMRAVSSRTISIARWSRHLSSLMQFLHCS